MRANKTKAKIKAGQPVFGAFVSVPAPQVVEILGYLGYDFVIIDCEHGGADPSMVENMIRAAELTDVTPLVRVPRNEPNTVGWYLDRGAQGVQVPMTHTKEAVEAVIMAAKYHPQGMRGLGAARPAEYFLTGPRSAYFEAANRETLVVCQIENTEAVRNLPQILTVEGVDVFFIGPGDLSQSLGLPDQIDHPEVVKVIDEVVASVVQAGKVPGFVSFKEAEYMAKGVRYIAHMDGNLFTSGARQWIEAMRRYGR